MLLWLILVCIAIGNLCCLRELIVMQRLCMQVRRGTWQGIPAVYKVWDLGDSLEPLLDMQDELDAYETLRPLQASVTASLLHKPLVDHASGFVHSMLCISISAC